MTDCIFCKLRDGKIPSAKIYEDDKSICFLDISPISPGHALLIPKKHSETIMSADDEDLKHLILVTKKLSPAIMKATGATGLNIGVNNHKSSGQVVFHTHFHLIPRHDTDGLRHWPQGKYNDGEMNKWAEKIKKQIQ
ncbi:MAG: HIT family protein [Nanoarchaeota archaeon]|nr:MAG: HIT family protein [Nanoarchaeota archaeon]